LAAGAVAFPYVIPGSALGKNGAVAPSNRIVMGAIGVGAQGKGDLRGFLARPDVQMVAICDVDRRHSGEAKEMVDRKYDNQDCAVHGDFREMIARGDLDAVQLALPDHWHGVISVAAVRAGLDVHAQKPLARTIREGQAVVDAVKRHGVVWQTGSQQRSRADFHHACQLVRNGRIGKVHHVEVGLPNGYGSEIKQPEPVPDSLDYDMWLGPAPWRPYTNLNRPSGPHWNWRWIMDYSGGMLTDWAGHHLDIAHWGLGLDRTGPVEVEGRGTYPTDGIYDVPITYKITCRYATGVEITIANSSDLPHEMGTAWYGENGTIHVNRNRLWSEPADVLKEAIGPDEIRLYKSRDHKQNFLDCVKTRRETACPADIGHRSISVALLGEIAMLTGRRLRWDPEKEIFINDAGANRYLSRPMRSPWHL